MSNATHKITTESGLEEFEIEFADRGVTEIIKFNPTDADLPKRLIETQKIIEEKLNGLKPFKVEKDTLPDADDCLEYLESLNKIIYDAVDYAYGNKISDKVFKYCSPLAVINGEYYIYKFMNQMAAVLEPIIGESKKKANEKLNKHLARYMKK